MIADLSEQHDVRVTLDHAGVIQDATVANDIVDERVADWFGRRWVETLDGVNQTRFVELAGIARTEGVSPVFLVTQRFPSGLMVPIEYFAFPSSKGGLIAVGRDVRAVAQLQSRLAAVQQSMEQGYWQLRDVENRYRIVFERSGEAMAIVHSGELRIVEANPTAVAAFGFAGLRTGEIAGYPLLDLIAPADRSKVDATMERARQRGKAPRIIVHLNHGNAAWLLRISVLDVERGDHLLLHLLPSADAQQAVEQVDTGQTGRVALVDSSPDGVVVISDRGDIVSVNRTFLELVQEGAPEKVLGTPLGNWLRPPGGDVQLLLDCLHLQRVVRLFPTSVYSRLGARKAVEVAAAQIGDSGAATFGVYVRDVSCRLHRAEDSVRFGQLLDTLIDQLGHASLKDLIGTTVGLVERHVIEAALAATDGNRTATAKLLDMSRQSLYGKLARYGMAENGFDE